MNYRDLMGLLTLGMLWGASFLFIRVAVPEFGAIVLMAVRVTLAAAVLLPFLLYRGQLRLVLEHWRAISLMGVLHYALPFTLFAYSMLTLSAGYSSVINASAPLFAALVTWIWMGERLNASRTTGLIIGMLGVVLLVWEKLALGSSPVVLAVLAAVLASFCYGFAAVLAKKKLAGVDPIAVVAGSMVAAALVLLPLSFLLWPATTPSIDAWGIAAALGILCTAAAFVLYFRLIAAVGPSRAITVTYLIPVFAVVFGGLFVDERITATMIAGGLVVALGTSLSTGLIDLQMFMRKTGVLAVRSLGLLIVFAAAIDAPEDAHVDERLVGTPVYLGANTVAFSAGDGREMFE
jgi:drug/metabolite transporter (DMT)-like permease